MPGLPCGRREIAASLSARKPPPGRLGAAPNGVPMGGRDRDVEVSASRCAVRAQGRDSRTTCPLSCSRAPLVQCSSPAHHQCAALRSPVSFGFKGLLPRRGQPQACAGSNLLRGLNPANWPLRGRTFWLSKVAKHSEWSHDS